MPKQIPNCEAYASKSLVRELNEKVVELQEEVKQLKLMVDLLFDKPPPTPTPTTLDQTEPRLELELSPVDNQMAVHYTHQYPNPNPQILGTLTLT